MAYYGLRFGLFRMLTETPGGLTLDELIEQMAAFIGKLRRAREDERQAARTA